MTSARSYFRHLGSIGQRLDGWVNQLTGYGTERDRTAYSVYYPDAPLQLPTLTNLYNGSSTARKIVGLEPGEMLREGFEIKCDDPAWSERIQREAERLGVHDAMYNGTVWGRLYGGDLLWIGADDGRDPAEPLAWQRVTTIKFLDSFDPQYAHPAGLRMLSPEHWDLWGIEGGTARVHESRILRFKGAHTPAITRRGNAGWDYSVLQALLSDIQAFDEAFHSASIMLSDASQSVIKLNGLIAALAGGQESKMRIRAQLLDMSRSVARALFLDKEEDFEKVATSFSGVAEVLGMAAKRLSAATGIPVAVLLGESPAGLQATGAIDIRIFYDHVAAERKRTLQRPLLFLLNLIAYTLRCPHKVRIEWPSLWQESPKEQADTRLVIAQADKIYSVDIGAVTPEDVAKSRWGKGEYSAEMQIDPNAEPGWARPPPTLPGTPAPGNTLPQ